MSEIEWTISPKPIGYEDAVHVMEETVADIRAGKSPEQIWLLEHPPLYTAGTSAKAEDLLNPQFPVFDTGRGGQYTYHGPGQRVAYVMLDLKQRQQTPDIKQYVCQLEQWIIDTIAEFGIKGERREGRVGIWVDKQEHFTRHRLDTPPPSGSGVADDGDKKSEAKIAAIGVRVRHWVTYHGISINLNPDLEHFNGIIPCGISDAGVTSFADLGIRITMDELDKALQANFKF